jgi:hypothetical protein
MAKPKLALIPAAQGSKFYSVLPSDGVGDFDFARASAATRINKYGLIETVASGQSRLNYPLIDGVVNGCPSHLLEPTRSNLIVNSQALSLSPIKNGTFTDDFAISPDGTQNATKLTATDSDPFFYQSVSFAAASYTASIYVKGIGSSIGKDFRIVLGALSSYPKLIIPSEWTRFEYTATMSSGSFNAGLEIPDPAVSGDEVLIWGWQVEQGSYATSYIPTSGTTVTRSAETANNSGDASTFNDSEGVLMAEISAKNDGVSKRISISDGGYANRVVLDFSSVANTLNCFVISGGVIQYNPSEVLSDITLNNKIGLKYKENDFSLFINGFEFDIDTNGIAPSGLNSLQFADGDGGASPFYGNTKQLQYFDSALTDSELETLTSWISFQDMAEGQLYTIE